MPIPDFIVRMREKIGHDEMWLPGITAVVTRPADDGAGMEVLLVRRADNGAWTPITGIPEPGEEAAAAALREVREETGCRARVERLASTSAHPGVVHANGDRAAYLDLTFACSYVSGQAHVADDESIDVGWFAPADFPPMAESMRWRIDSALTPEPAAWFGL